VPALAQTQFDDIPTGYLTPGIGGMPADAWNGTSLGTAKRLVSALPAAPRSRALRDLQFKVMVSELVTPTPDNSPPPTLFARKVEKLAAMGEGENLNEMVRNSGGYDDPAIATMTANALMMAGEKAGGCAIARGHQMTEPFGKRALAACDGDVQALGNNVFDGPAMIALDLSRVRLPASVLASTQPPMMRALVANHTLSLVTRIEVAERGEAGAIIEASRLSDLYREALHDNVALPGPIMRRAQLVAAVSNATNAAEIMQSITAVYTETRGSPLFPTIARATAQGLLRLDPRKEFAQIALEATRGFLLLGDKRRTEAWIKLAFGAAANNPGTLNGLERLLPLAAIAGVENPRTLPPQEVDRWYATLRQDDPGRAALRGNLLLELFRATGIDVPAGSTSLPEQAAGGRPVSNQTLQALQSSANGHRRAETALLASLAVAESSLGDLAPSSAGYIVRCLRAVGEDEAARLFAIEVAIAYGL
jgi:hypothetical protein